MKRETHRREDANDMSAGTTEQNGAGMTQARGMRGEKAENRENKRNADNCGDNLRQTDNHGMQFRREICEG